MQIYTLTREPTSFMNPFVGSIMEARDHARVYTCPLCASRSTRVWPDWPSADIIAKEQKHEHKRFKVRHPERYGVLRTAVRDEMTKITSLEEPNSPVRVSLRTVLLVICELK